MNANTFLEASPIIGLCTGLYILGGLFNSPVLQPNQSEIQIGTDLPCNKHALYNVTQALLENNLTTNAINTLPANSIKDPLIVAVSAALSLVPIFLTGFELNSAKINALSSLGLGHAATFGTSETMKHFFIKPDDIFFQMCNLPYEDCVSLKHQMLLVLGHLKPQEQSVEEIEEEEHLKCFFPNFKNHLHSVPNISLGLLAASATMFLFNIYKFKQMSHQPIRAHKLHIKIALFVSFVILLFCVISSLYETNKRNLSDHMLSIGYGIFVQYFICFILDNKATHQPLLPSPPPPPQ